MAPLVRPSRRDRASSITVTMGRLSSSSVLNGKAAIRVGHRTHRSEVAERGLVGRFDDLDGAPRFQDAVALSARSAVVRPLAFPQLRT